MSVLEMVKTKVKELTDPNGPANGLLHSAKGVVAHGLDGASKFVDEKTNGKYSSAINTGVGKAKEFLGEQDESKDAPSAAGDAAAAEGDAPKPSASDTTPKSEPAIPPKPEPSTPPKPQDPGTAGPAAGPDGPLTY